MTVGRVVEEAVADEPDDISAVVIALVGDLFLEHGANGNHDGKRIAEYQELQEKFPAQNTQAGGENDRADAHDLDHWSKQLKQTQIEIRKSYDSDITRAEKQGAILPTDVLYSCQL